MRSPRYMKGGYIGTAKIIGDTSDRSANVEPVTSIKREKAHSDKAFHSPVRITVISYRCRLADSDGISAKAAIDGLVRCGILRDDSPEFVTEVRYRQIKVKTKDEQKTVIEIEEVSYGITRKD